MVTVKMNKRQYIDLHEKRKRKREGIIIVVAIVVVVALSFLESYLSHRGNAPQISNSVLIFGLININIILIILLIFLIIRNVVKLIFERRHGIIGSKLRTKLVVAFVSLSLIPTVILFFVAINFLSSSIDNWFSLVMGDTLNKTVEIAQIYYEQTAERAKYSARQLSADITENHLYESGREQYLRLLLEKKQKNSKLGMIEIYFDNRKENFVFRDPDHQNVSPEPFSPEIVENIFTGKEVSMVQSSGGTKMIGVPIATQEKVSMVYSSGNGEVVKGLAPIYSSLTPKEVIGFVAVTYYVPPNLSEKINSILKTSEQYRRLNLLEKPIRLGYIGALAIVTLLIVFSATWFGLFLAKGITVPIQDLAEATHKIAQGNLDHQFNIKADDEIGVLVDSFNRMTKDLKANKEKVEQINRDLEQHGKYMEAILKNVSTGVISVDENHVITTINRAAEGMLDIKTQKVMNRPYDEVLMPEHKILADELLKEMQEKKQGFIEKQIELTLKNKVLTVLITTTVIKDDHGNDRGMVIVFEDITQLQKAERAAAWREVARRMAHEIKNPLTPVQLSAQRLQKRYADKLGDDGAVFRECTETIIAQVELLKRMVNEFSQYARMPITKPEINDLNNVVADSIALFQEAHKDIRFDIEQDTTMPKLKFDSEQINRVMVNLLDNAVAAVLHGTGQIKVATSYDTVHQKAIVEVADNGSGVPAGYKMKMFEPYFSTKRSGTGLGLAIVSSIISDHHGQINVKDNIPKGTVVAFELPVSEA
jgi:two-component system nitrogen regulation sensor histidine kinase NtrY